LLDGDSAKAKPAAPQFTRGKRKRQRQERSSTTDDDEIESSSKENTVPPKRRKVDEKRPTKRKPGRGRKRAESETPLSGNESTNCPDSPEPADSVPEGPSSLNVFALGFEETGGSGETATAAGKTTKGRYAGGNGLQAKVASGRANENYVKVNIKKKVFSRGKRGGAAALRAEQRRKLDLKVS
jgi:hypothetical protein